MNGLVLDASAMLAYAAGQAEPGALLQLAADDPQQQVWLPATCLAEAFTGDVGPGPAGLLDLLAATGVVEPLTAGNARLVGRRSDGLGVSVGHAFVCASVYRAYLVTADALVAARAPKHLSVLNIAEGWD